MPYIGFSSIASTPLDALLKENTAFDAIAGANNAIDDKPVGDISMLRTLMVALEEVEKEITA